MHFVLSWFQIFESCKNLIVTISRTIIINKRSLRKFIALNRMHRISHRPLIQIHLNGLQSLIWVKASCSPTYLTTDLISRIEKKLLRDISYSLGKLSFFVTKGRRNIVIWWRFLDIFITRSFLSIKRKKCPFISLTILHILTSL